ncbi:MAG: MFS transporter [Hyphomonas sp.]|nr:MFS transporter [Hyphomonas sp.]
MKFGRRHSRADWTRQPQKPFKQHNAQARATEPDLAPEGDPADDLQLPRRTLAIIAVLAAMVMVVVDSGVTTVALPSIGRAFQIAPAEAILVVTAYQTALVMALLPCAALGERIGYRRAFVSGIVTFMAASLSCALSPNLFWLLLARFVQGLGGAGVLALGVALLRFSVADGRLSAAIGWNALTVAIAAATGPAIGALMLSQLDWPWIYALNLPLGAGVLVAARALPQVSGQGGRLDAVSIGLNCAFFLFFVTGAQLMMSASSLSAICLGAAGLVGTALIRREKSKAKPLIPLDLLERLSFRISVLASVCCFAGQTAGLLALTFHLQHGLGKSPMVAGLYMTVWPLSVAATAALTNRRLSEVPTGLLCVVGGVALSMGLAALALWSGQGDPNLLLPLTALCGAGFGLFQVANNRNMFLSTPRERSGAAGALQGVARVSGQTVGAVLVALLFAIASQRATDQIVFGVASALTLAASLISMLRAGTK